MKRIILDTNVLISMIQFGFDVFSELERICDFSYDIVVTDGILEELQSIKDKQRGKHKLAAVTALQLVKKKNLTVLKTKSKDYVDNVLYNLSKEDDIIILTQDTGLKKRLLKGITVRQKKYLVFFP